MANNFQPHLANIGPCVTCHYWSEQPSDHVWNLKRKVVKGLANGCGHYEREPGSDDEVKPLSDANELVLQRIRSS